MLSSPPPGSVIKLQCESCGAHIMGEEEDYCFHCGRFQGLPFEENIPKKKKWFSDIREMLRDLRAMMHSK
jgi:hypothetical protein